jgi:luciferase-like monooxygenase
VAHTAVPAWVILYLYGQLRHALNKERIVKETAAEIVRQAVEKWKGVTTHDHRFGGIEFRLGRRELGHLHRSFADLPFPRKIRDALVQAGRARPHHILPESGWVTVSLRTASEVQNVIELFRENYERYMSLDKRAADLPADE